MPRSETTRRRSRRRGRVGNAVLAVITFLVFLIMALPLIAIIGASLTAGTSISFPPQGVSLQYYIEAAQRSDVVSAFLVSITVGFGSAILAMIFGVPAAIGLVRYRFRGRGIVTQAIMSPLLVPAVVLGIILLNWFVLVLNWQTSQYLLIAGHLLITLPFVVRLAMTSLTSFDSRLEQAARGLGAGSLRAFFSVTMPNILPGLVGAFAFAFIRSFDDVGISLFLSARGVQTLPVLVFTYLTQTYDPLILAVASFTIVLVIVVMVVLDRVVGVSQVAMASYGGRRRAPTITTTP